MLLTVEGREVHNGAIIGELFPHYDGTWEINISKDGAQLAVLLAMEEIAREAGKAGYRVLVPEGGFTALFKGES